MGFMAHFNAARAMYRAIERGEHITAGTKFVPVVTSVMAVLAAIATLFANHSSISALTEKNEALLFQSKAADQYGYYESTGVKAQLDRSMLDTGLVSSRELPVVEGHWRKEKSEAAVALKQAQSLEADSEEHSQASETRIKSYEKFEVAATLFEVAVVLASIAALLLVRAPLLAIAAAASLIGLGFTTAGFLR